MKSLCAIAFVLSLTACGQQYSINPDSLADIGIDPTKEPNTEIVTKSPDAGSDTGKNAGSGPSSGNSQGTPVASNDPTKSSASDPTKASSSTDPNKSDTPKDGTSYSAPDAPDQVVSRTDKKHGKYCVIKDHDAQPMRCQKGANGDMDLPPGLAKTKDTSKPQKALICHNYNKNANAHRVTLALPAPAIAAHLAHGDVPGACDDYQTKEQADMAVSGAACRSGDKSDTKKSTSSKSSDPTKTVDSGDSDKTPPMYQKCDDSDEGDDTTTVASQD